MRKDSKPPVVKAETFKEKIALTILGGMGLFIATAVLNAMFSAPVSRAEFNKHEAEATRHLKNIDGRLNELKSGQDRIIDHLLKQGR